MTALESLTEVFGEGGHGDNSEQYARELLAEHRAEVLAADGQAYDGELAMLRGLVRTLRAVVRDDRADVAQREVRRLLYEHAADERAAYEQGKSSSRQADATPDTLAAWLAHRFDPNTQPWDGMSDDDRSHWEHEAAAVRRAARGGFKTDVTEGEGQ